MKALIFNGKVVDKQQKSFSVHPSMKWVKCDDTIEVGDTYKDNQFSKPPEPVLDYTIERRFNYPHLADFADAFYWAQRGDATKMDEYLAKCDEIKTKYPKPESN